MLSLALAPPVSAFTTGPHEEITAGAMADEGFGHDAIELTQDNNTFMDLYQWVGASANPYSGQGTSLLGRVLIGNIGTEEWSMATVAAATRGHFDNNPEGIKEGLSREGLMDSLGTTAGMTAEWQRLQRAVWTILQEARVENDPQKALAVLGASLHEVQDFYAHTNWVEPLPGQGLAGSDGPGWHERGLGSYPTWFDISPQQREKFMIYGDSTPGHTRNHGYWASNMNRNVVSSMNKDSPPRPYYLEASITAYFASRQWVEAARQWINDDAFWDEMQTYQVNGKTGRELEEELQKQFDLMRFSGRWEAQGEPWGGPSGMSGAAGDLLELRSAVKDYFGNFDKTPFRKQFERLIVRMEKRNPVGQVAPVPSSQELQRQMEIMVLRIKKMQSVGALGLGDVWPDEADMYAEMRIDGQPYHSDVIHGNNEFTFSNPYEPFTKFKVIPKDKIEQEPVESIELHVGTADVQWAGTDDDVHVRLGNGLRFGLNKLLENDFERGDRATYSIGIDNAAHAGLTVGDINQLVIEKDSDGIAGGWKLGGLQLWINGQKVYENENINRWIEDGRLSWRAPDFVSRNPTGPKIPVWLGLWDDDFDGAWFPDYNPYDPLSGSDDLGDINPYDRRDSISYGYVPGKKVEITSRGGKRLEGRRGCCGDDASITFTLETLYAELIGTSGASAAGEEGSGGQAPPAPALPDLVITELKEGSATVNNTGAGAAGFFRLRVRGMGGNGEDTEIFTGLAPGASETRSLSGIPACEPTEAVVDDLEQVGEENEENNTVYSMEPGPSCLHNTVVPDVRGEPQEAAMEELFEANLRSSPLPEPTIDCDRVGLVTSQTPHGGTEVPQGWIVTIMVAARDPKHPCR